MHRLIAAVLLGLGLALAVPASAQVGTRAYAPEDLRSLSYNDQVRVISLEYSEQSRGRRIPDDQLRFYIDQVNRSNWTFSRIKQDIATSLAGGNPSPGGQTVRCESQRGIPSTCPVPWNGNSRLVRQLSGTGCVEGQTWRSQPGAVQVYGGCRGEFARARGDGRPPVGSYQVTCSSKDNRYTTCAWDRSHGRPRLLQQLSGSPCIENRTWGYSQQQGLWVTSGCRARFGGR
jgi:hypothetical protein